VTVSPSGVVLVFQAHGIHLTLKLLQNTAPKLGAKVLIHLNWTPS